MNRRAIALLVITCALMASVCADKSDGFFTSDYHKEIYTEAGLAWIRCTGIKEIIPRHHPNLKSAIADVGNPFSPWRNVI